MPDRSGPGHGMTREQLAAEVERLRPWFHAIELPHGVWTKRESAGTEPADHPAGTWEVVRRHLPPDLAGKSVLDVGCSAGFYSVQAKRLGAARVLGVDARQHEIRQALLVRRALGLDVEIRRQSVYSLSPARTGRFDVVLALGLIYHCKHLVLALEKLFSVTGDLLVVETEVIPEPAPAAAMASAPPAGAMAPPPPAGAMDPPPGVIEEADLGVLAGRPLHSLAFVHNPQRIEEAVANWFVPSPGAARALLRAAGFAQAEVAARFGARAVLVCRRAGGAGEGGLGLTHFAARISLLGDPGGAAGGGTAGGYRVAVVNTGAAAWRARGEPGTGRGAVRLGSHLLRADETEVAWDFAFAALPHDLAPGERAELALPVEPPGEPGEYVLELDLVREGIGWFEEGGGATLRLPLVVE
jgi:tRNA (mo5U34)-methyltransferase